MDTRTLCLAVLNEGDASGYEIKKTLERAPYCHFQDTGFGSIYPALNRLSETGQVRVTELAQEKRPDKKVYSITESGRAHLVAELMEPPGADRFRSDFLFVLFHGEQLPWDRLSEVIDRRIADLEAQIKKMEECCLRDQPPARRFVHAFGLDYYRNSAKFLRENRDRLGRELAAPEVLVAE